MIPIFLYMIENFVQIFGKFILMSIALTILFFIGKRTGELNGLNRSVKVMKKALDVNKDV